MLRFDILNYMMIRTRLHEGFAYLSDNTNDNTIIKNLDYWSWDGVKILDQKIDPLLTIIRIFTFRQFKDAQFSDIRCEVPTQVIGRNGHPTDFQFNANK